jgi:serine/threonine-protein kinase
MAGIRRSNLIADRFELSEMIGRGAMGSVWSARDRRTGAEVAVKIARSLTAGDRGLRERFEQEGRLLRRLRSPFITAFVHAGSLEGDVPFVVIERLTGETVEALLDRERYLPLVDAAKIVDEVLQGLIVAHGAGIVHRDLGPANVFLHREPAETVVTKILDFGIAKDTARDLAGAATPLTANRTTMGSIVYVAPEQLGGSSRAGPRADLYAVGTLFFQLLSGRTPFGAARGGRLMLLKREHATPTIGEVTGERWPAALQTFLTKMTARSPSARYTSAEVALECLREAVGQRRPLAIPPPSVDGLPTTTLKRGRGRSS